MGKVIAKSEGPKYNGEWQGCLTIGKEYKVLSVHHYSVESGWIVERFSFNPKETKFYLEVVDDRGRVHSIWNDHFYPTEEVREKKLNLLLDGD